MRIKEKIMKKKIFLTLVIVMALACLFAVSVSAAKLRVDDYDAKYTLVNKADICYWYGGNYSVDYEYTYTDAEGTEVTETRTLTGTRGLSGVTNSNVPITFIDEQGNIISEVPMWEYDAEDGKYYSLVWYIADATFEYTEVQVADISVECKDLGTNLTTTLLDLQGNPLKTQTYTHATYTLKSARAIDLTVTTDSWSKTFNNTYGDWSWDSSVKYTRLKGIYLDSAKTIKLHDNSNELSRNNDNYGGSKGYISGYTNPYTSEIYQTSLEAQMFAGNGNRIVVANLRDRTDIQGDRSAGYGSANTWNNARNLQCLWYPDTVKFIEAGVGPVYELDLGNGIEIIDCQLLRDNQRLKDLVIPNSCVYLGNESFRGSNPSTIVFGENMRWNGSYGGGGNIHTAYISKNFVTLFEGTFSNFLGNKNVTIYFDGNSEEALALQTKLETQLTDRTFTHYDYKTTTERESSSGIAIFYNYNRCDAFYTGNHATEAIDTCQGKCSRCEEITLLPEPQHANVWVFTNENGGTASITAVIIATETCQNCKHEGEVKTIDAIFKSTGYSYEMNGNEYTGIYQKTSVDTEALALYSELTGNKDAYNFGIVAGLAADANDNPIDGNLITATNGEANLANETTVIGTFLNTEYTIMEIKVTGVTSASQLYCGAFIVTGNDVTYLCGTTQDSVATKATFPKEQ